MSTSKTTQLDQGPPKVVVSGFLLVGAVLRASLYRARVGVRTCHADGGEKR
jgi:hypothetical protein